MSKPFPLPQKGDIEVTVKITEHGSSGAIIINDSFQMAVRRWADEIIESAKATTCDVCKKKPRIYNIDVFFTHHKNLIRGNFCPSDKVELVKLLVDAHNWGQNFNFQHKPESHLTTENAICLITDKMLNRLHNHTFSDNEQIGEICTYLLTYLQSKQAWEAKPTTRKPLDFIESASNQIQHDNRLSTLHSINAPSGLHDDILKLLLDAHFHLNDPTVKCHVQILQDVYSILHDLDDFISGRRLSEDEAALVSFLTDYAKHFKAVPTQKNDPNGK